MALLTSTSEFKRQKHRKSSDCGLPGLTGKFTMAKYLLKHVTLFFYSAQ